MARILDADSVLPRHSLLSQELSIIENKIHIGTLLHYCQNLQPPLHVYQHTLNYICKTIYKNILTS